MPLFRSSRNDPERITPVEDTPARRGSLFSRRRVASPLDTTTDPATQPNRSSTDGISPTSRTGRGGFFSRRHGSSSGSDLSDRRAANNHGAAAAAPGAAGTGTGFFGGNRLKDATLDAARGKVHVAELAEKEAVSTYIYVHCGGWSDF